MRGFATHELRELWELSRAKASSGALVAMAQKCRWKGVRRERSGKDEDENENEDEDEDENENEHAVKGKGKEMSE